MAMKTHDDDNIIIIIINFSLFGQEISPMSQTKGGFTKAMLCNVSYYILIKFAVQSKSRKIIAAKHQFDIHVWDNKI